MNIVGYDSRKMSLSEASTRGLFRQMSKSFFDDRFCTVSCQTSISGAFIIRMNNTRKKTNRAIIGLYSHRGGSMNEGKSY